MSVIDTPDGQYTTVGGQVLLGQGVVGTNLTVTLPANCESLLIYVQETELPASPPLVRGLTSSVYYPVTFLDYVNITSQTSIWAAMVTSVIDTQVSIDCQGSSGAAFYVVSDSAARLIGDLVLGAASGAAGVAAPNLAVQVAGTDGTDLRVLKTDASGNLNVNIISGGGGSLTYAESYITSFVQLAVANTIYNVTSVSLAAGTWLITGRALVQNTTTPLSAMDLFLSPTSASTTGAYAATSASNGDTAGGEEYSPVSVTKVVVLTATTTVYLAAICSSANAYVLAASAETGLGNASGITALKIA